MNIRLLFSLLLVIFISNVFSQENPFVVDVAPRITNGDTQITFVAFIPNGSIALIEKNWLRYVAANSSGSATFSKGIHLQTNAINANVSDKPFDVNSRLEEVKNGVQLSVWMNQDGKFFRGDGSRNNGDLAVKNYLRDFAVKEYKDVLNRQLLAGEQKQKELEAEYASLRKHNQGYVNKEVESNSDGLKNGKQNKKHKSSDRNADRNHELLVLKMIEIDTQKKIVQDSKVRLTEVR